MILHHLSSAVFGWLLLLILNISASWNLSTPPDSVGCPSSVLPYYSQLHFSLFSFPLRCEFSKGRSNQWEIEDEVINFFFFLESVGLNIYQYKLQAYLCVLDHGSGYSHPAYHRRGKWALDRTLEKATKVPLYVTKAMKKQKVQFSGTREISGWKESHREKWRRGVRQRDLNVLKWAHICRATANP